MIWKITYFSDREQTHRTRTIYTRARTGEDASTIAAQHMADGEVSADITRAVFGSGLEPGPMVAPKI